jgi:hypothetical protein
MYNSTESFALINGCVILPTMSEVLTKEIFLKGSSQLVNLEWCSARFWRVSVRGGYKTSCKGNFK